MTRWIFTLACLLVPGQADAFQPPGSRGTKPPASNTEPRLPGALTRAPEGIGPGAPFNVTEFFAAPPSELNAAPLYLDALFEFDPGMAICFPIDAETTRRRESVEPKMRRLREAYQAFHKDPNSVSGETIDRLVTDFKIGMIKLEEAQRRPRCVFQPGFDFNSLIPHSQSAREVARLVVFRTRRNLDRGNVDQPLRDLGILLRLARDLRPRGVSISQLVANALTAVAHVEVIRPLLASPLFRDQHARRLLDLLVKHEAGSINGYEEAVKSDYIIARVCLASMVSDPRGSIATIDQLMSNSGAALPGLNEARVRTLEQEIKKMTPAEIARANGRVDDYFRDLLALKNLPFPVWLEKQPNPRRIEDGSSYSKVPAHLIQAIPNVAESQARMEVQIRAYQCLVALKLWKYRTNRVPADLATVAKAAGLRQVPIDSYSGQPLRMAIINGEPVVYSVGKDGRDDGGRVDSDFDRKPGDQTFRLPTVEKRKR